MTLFASQTLLQLIANPFVQWNQANRSHLKLSNFFNRHPERVTMHATVWVQVARACKSFTLSSILQILLLNTALLFSNDLCNHLTLLHWIFTCISVTYNRMAIRKTMKIGFAETGKLSTFLWSLNSAWCMSNSSVLNKTHSALSTLVNNSTVIFPFKNQVCCSLTYDCWIENDAN